MFTWRTSHASCVLPCHWQTRQCPPGTIRWRTTGIYFNASGRLSDVPNANTHFSTILPSTGKTAHTHRPSAKNLKLPSRSAFLSSRH